MTNPPTTTGPLVRRGRGVLLSRLKYVLCAKNKNIQKIPNQSRQEFNEYIHNQRKADGHYQRKADRRMASQSQGWHERAPPLLDVEVKKSGDRNKKTSSQLSHKHMGTSYPPLPLYRPSGSPKPVPLDKRTHHTQEHQTYKAYQSNT